MHGRQADRLADAMERRGWRHLQRRLSLYSPAVQPRGVAMLRSPAPSKPDRLMKKGLTNGPYSGATAWAFAHFRGTLLHEEALCPRKGTTRPGRGLVVRTSSIGGAENAAYFAYPPSKCMLHLESATMSFPLNFWLQRTSRSGPSAVGKRSEMPRMS